MEPPSGSSRSGNCKKACPQNGTINSNDLSQEQIVYFRNELRLARETAQKDAENFHDLIVAFETLGRYLHKGNGHGSLDQYRENILQIARKSPLAWQIPEKHRTVHTPAEVLYELVRNGRNSEMHEGVSARVLTQHTIQLSIILEDGLLQFLMNENISDIMIPNPVITELWHPISFLRQNMLANSFTYLPFEVSQGKWGLVSDLAIANYLQSDRRERLRQPLHCAIDQGLNVVEVDLIDASEPRNAALQKMGGTASVLLVTQTETKQVIGILTAFDLL